MRDSDLPRIADEPWIEYLQGKDPDFPMQSIAADRRAIRETIDRVRKDTKTEDTRSSGEMQDPVKITSLIHQMLGAPYPGGGGNVLHAQVRYFDPKRQRPGLPPDVAALVDHIDTDGISLTLVNSNVVNPRKLIVQTGSYAEHQAVSVDADGEVTQVGDSHFTVRLAPGAGQRLRIRMKRFANQPTFRFPWDR